MPLCRSLDVAAMALRPLSARQDADGLGMPARLGARRSGLCFPAICCVRRRVGSPGTSFARTFSGVCLGAGSKLSNAADIPRRILRRHFGSGSPKSRRPSAYLERKLRTGSGSSKATGRLSLSRASTGTTTTASRISKTKMACSIVGISEWTAHELPCGRPNYSQWPIVRLNPTSLETDKRPPNTEEKLQ